MIDTGLAWRPVKLLSALIVSHTDIVEMSWTSIADPAAWCLIGCGISMSIQASQAIRDAYCCSTRPTGTEVFTSGDALVLVI